MISYIIQAFFFIKIKTQYEQQRIYDLLNTEPNQIFLPTVYKAKENLLQKKIEASP